MYIARILRRGFCRNSKDFNSLRGLADGSLSRLRFWPIITVIIIKKPPEGAVRLVSGVPVCITKYITVLGL